MSTTTRSRTEEAAEIVALLAPYVQMDGGDLVLVSVDEEAGIIELELQGACSSCAISASTLSGGVERILRERLDWVTEVRGGVAEDDYDYSRSLGRGAYVPKSE